MPDLIPPHDPLCPVADPITGKYAERCECDLIARVITRIRAEKPDFHYTLYPNGKVQTLIVDGTNWVSVASANAQEDRARADERQKIDTAVELLNIQRVLHASLIAPDHPNSPVLIEVNRVLAILTGDAS